MKTYYQKTNAPSAINGINAVSMSDEIRAQLEGKAEFLDENSKEVQTYLAGVKEREDEALTKIEAAQLAADEQEAAAKIVKDKFPDELAEHIKEKKAKRQSEGKAAKTKK
jgi:hypothetical protein